MGAARRRHGRPAPHRRTGPAGTRLPDEERSLRTNSSSGVRVWTVGLLRRHARSSSEYLAGGRVLCVGSASMRNDVHLREINMQIALVLYPKFTMLDIIGPFQVLSELGDEVVFVAYQAGHVPDHTGRAGLIATSSLDEVPHPDVVVVPGGFGDTELDVVVVEWLRRVHPTTTWTTSVCTGAIYLAAAGILDG